MLREFSGQAVESFHALKLFFTSSQGRDRFAIGVLRGIAQEQSIVAAVSLIRRVGSHGSATQLEVKSEIADDFFGKKANEIRVTREPGIVIRKDFLRGGCPADVVVLF